MGVSEVPAPRETPKLEDLINDNLQALLHTSRKPSNVRDSRKKKKALKRDRSESPEPVAKKRRINNGSAVEVSRASSGRQVEPRRPSRRLSRLDLEREWVRRM